ncbi:hypothetical protein BD410DRAFT_780889 [Rickenella mellea]|uniref:COX assembly mitochondrial protein n=1 Tax=Rickenella mellea TaxID=50990 RepID=A0A4Y7QNE1_9AGAM|nr:hypothetical protein BD410DRAFT_780889 [Rickenella mellea]
MQALSRREEEALLKVTKARAMKECDPLVKQFAECATGRFLSIAWSCRIQHQNVQHCMQQFTKPESMDILRAEYVRIREQRNSSLPQAPQP